MFSPQTGRSPLAATPALKFAALAIGELRNAGASSPRFYGGEEWSPEATKSQRFGLSNDERPKP
jgi:hypothetical protein